MPNSRRDRHTAKMLRITPSLAPVTVLGRYADDLEPREQLVVMQHWNSCGLVVKRTFLCECTLRLDNYVFISKPDIVGRRSRMAYEFAVGADRQNADAANRTRRHHTDRLILIAYCATTMALPATLRPRSTSRTCS